jgi:hypothetical protein
LSRRNLVARACAALLSSGLSRFSSEELAAAPVLDPAIDGDACRPPSIGARLRAIFAAAFAR